MELGAVLLSISGLVPDGMVVFLPSYSFLDKVKLFWSKSGLIQKLADRKEVSSSCSLVRSFAPELRIADWIGLAFLRTADFWRC